MQTFFIAPTGYDVGLTSSALGIVRALERLGLKVGFIKPIAQTMSSVEGVELSVHFASKLLLSVPPSPIPFNRAERLMSDGQQDLLMEEIISVFEQGSKGKDVVIVEGLAPDNQHVFVTTLNASMARNLNAETIFVTNAGHHTITEIAEQIEIAIHQFSLGDKNKIAGYILNKVESDSSAVEIGAQIRNSSRMLKQMRLPQLGAIPFAPELTAPRMLDIARHLNAKILCDANIRHARVRDIVIAARSVPNMVDRLKPGALVVTPGDRDDVVLATAFAAMKGIPLAGMLLTCDSEPDPRISALCQHAINSRIPVLLTDMDTYHTANEIMRLRPQVPEDDIERMEQVIDFVAWRIDTDTLRQKINTITEPRLSPPAFRYNLIQQARKANKRVVLPEGEEPRTICAAVICHEKGIARCVLLGNPETIREVALAQGVTLPDDLEIMDPSKERNRYIEPMVELRKNKGLNAPMAEKQLEDNVVMGTMMLALDEVDGLVSGAIHTTANTVRPALQLIKTAPGARIVSSIFFMLMQEQVLVYGDCAINPEPTAEELADIAIQSADSATAFGIAPRVAMISYSTGTSGAGSDVDKVREATETVRRLRPDILVDGPLQYDAASVESVGRQKAPDSPVAGRATVFIFPDLNTGNTTYKAVQRNANVVAVGPMLQGLRKPVNDLSRGALVDDIVYTIALTAIQAAQAAVAVAPQTA